MTNTVNKQENANVKRLIDATIVKHLSDVHK